MSIKYHEEDVDVLLGDVVEYKPLILFWKRKKGRVSYIPGISKPHAEMEHNGLTWLGISGDDGTFRGIYIDPESNKVKKGIKFISRSVDDNYIGPDDLSDDEW